MNSQVEDLTGKLAAVALAAEVSDDEEEEIDGIEFVDYNDESQLEYVMDLVGRDLSEPYSSKHERTESRDGCFQLTHTTVVHGSHSLYVSLLLGTVSIALSTGSIHQRL